MYHRTGLIGLMLLLLGSSAPLLAADSAVLLMYHRFGEDRYPATNVRVDQFRAQLAMLRDGGFNVIPLSLLLEALDGRADLPERAVVLTVDDAYRSVYEVAWPMLREAGMPFTVFVGTDPVDAGSAAFMSWEQMREMARGGASFANHGASHRPYIALSPDETVEDRRRRVLADAAKARRRLAAELQLVEGVLAYPYGEFDAQAAGWLRDAGYLLFGQHSGAVDRQSDPRALPRFPVNEAYSDPAELRTKLSSRPLAVAAVEPWDPVTDEPLPRIDVTLGESDAALDRLACFVGGQGRVEVDWLEPGRRFRVGPTRPFSQGRHRVNCTAPGPGGRYNWFSHPWFVGHYDP